MLVRKDKPLTEIMCKKGFTFSCELVPPRNGEPAENIFKKVEILKKAGVDFISITRGAGGSLRGGTVPIAFLIKEKYKIPVIAHFTCMDSTIPEIENNVIDHSYLGITNILALRGDPPTGVFANYCATDNQHQYAYQLIKQIKELTEGKYILRKGFDADSQTFHEGEPLDFCMGAAAYPEPLDISLDKSVDYFVLKVKEGAQWAITQMIYSPENYKLFLKKLHAKGIDIPILPGVRVMISGKQAEFLQKTFKINIPEEYVDIINKNDHSLNKTFIKNLILEFRAAGARGIQFFVMNEAELVGEIIKEMKKMFRNEPYCTC